MDKIDLNINTDWWRRHCERGTFPPGYTQDTADGWLLHRELIPTPVRDRLDALQ